MEQPFSRASADPKAFLSPDFIPLLMRGLALGLTALYALTALIQLTGHLTSGELTIGRSILGGDFIAFRAAAQMIVDGRFVEMYDLTAYHAQLSTIVPKEEYWLMWQYPPMVNFLIWPLAYGSFQTIYVLYFTVTAFMLWCVLKEMKFSGQVMFLMLASPLIIPVMMVGQISLLTTGLLLTAVWFSDRRPILAGIAAGLLTIKPQLGVLLPFVFLAAGHYRTFVVAAVTAVVFMSLSALVFGLESWLAFFNSILRLHGDMLDTSAGATIPGGMTTVLSQFLLVGWSPQLGQLVHGVIAVIVAALVIMVWRQEKSHAVRAAFVCASIPLMSPYSYFYEMAVLIVPLTLIIQHALQTGWRFGERPALVFIFVSGIGYTSIPVANYIQFPLVMSLLTFLMILQRWGPLLPMPLVLSRRLQRQSV